MKMSKKGQAEDFFADLIPSLVIIGIGLFILSQMNTENEKITSSKLSALESALRTDITTVADDLNQEIDLDGKKMRLSELISLSYKNNEYQGKISEKIGGTKIATEAIAETIEQEKPEAIAGGREPCLKLEIQYPDGSTLNTGTDCKGAYSSTAYLPTYEGEYITANVTAGTK